VQVNALPGPMTVSAVTIASLGLGGSLAIDASGDPAATAALLQMRGVSGEPRDA
jgi:hypothetical protein